MLGILSGQSKVTPDNINFDVIWARDSLYSPEAIVFWYPPPTPTPASRRVYCTIVETRLVCTWNILLVERIVHYNVLQHPKQSLREKNNW